MAGQRKHWKAVRLAAAILGKVVDTLAPAITSMLVRGKEVGLGMGYVRYVGRGWDTWVMYKVCWKRLQNWVIL